MRLTALVVLLFIFCAEGFYLKGNHRNRIKVDSRTSLSASAFRFRERISNIFKRNKPKEKEVEEEEELEMVYPKASFEFEKNDVNSSSVENNSLPTGPSFLTDDICLLPGHPVVRIEIAPYNARRIFTGIDIFADVESVWKVLTNYESLHLVVPSLIKNEVLERYPDGGARIYQVGGANVLPGITFKASVTLDIRTYLEDSPLPSSKFQSYGFDGSSTSEEVLHEISRATPLKRGIFPRPYALTKLPFRDITMQNVMGAGDFEHYQGIWRMQSLPNCAPNGSDATRLTYAVEIRPKGFLPVALIEKRVASDLQANLEAIRTYVESNYRPVKEEGIFERNMQTESIDSSGLVSVLVTEVRELRRRVEELEKERENRRVVNDKIADLISSGRTKDWNW